MALQASIYQSLLWQLLTRRSGHLQTFYAVAGDFSAVNPLAYDRCVLLPLDRSGTDDKYVVTHRQLLRVKDGGTLSGFFLTVLCCYTQ